MLTLIEKFVNDNQMEFGHMTDALKKAAVFKYKEIIAETLSENSRRGHWCRIFPARGCEMYDGFFSGQRPLNKLMQKVLFSDDIMKVAKFFGA